ncbi:MAG: prolipoprotein diacylglyceryl transferase [Chloroflexi bacterium]|nr:prolipoprotein diacylglyceryl transferase [Chloroflexota bacterium]
MINIDINPIFFLSVRWYGVMIALGIVALLAWAIWQIKKGARIPYDTVFAAAVVAIPSGIIVSRALHIIDLWDYYSQNPGQIIGGSGLTIWGAVLGATLGVWVYSKFAKFQFGYLADMIAPGIILAQSIGRVGCTINGCCYGTETLLPWAIIYNHPDSLAPLGIPFHPTTVYEIIYLLIVFGVVLKLKDRLKPDGSLFLVYLGLYSIWRFGIDFLRAGTPFLFGLHQAQVISIVVLAIVVPLLVFRTRWVRAEAESVLTEGG